MSHTMERWYSVTGQRFSMRRYGGVPEEADLTALRDTAALLSDSRVRLVLCSDPNVFRALFLGAGKVQGTPCFAAVLAREGAACQGGYMGESLILEATARGLGSCWLGGSFKRGVAERAVQPQTGEKILCVIALGKPGEKYIGRPRKDLCALTGLEQAQLLALPEWQQSALSCARLAPSAVNAQPWRFFVEGSRLKIQRIGKNFGFALLDQGIAMLHMELGAAHGGVSGRWSWQGDTALFTPDPD